MIEFLQGGISKDHRGQIRFVNCFDMKNIKRFYIIRNSDLDLVRGWRAHKIEERWFYTLSGSFIVSLVKIDNWHQPSKELEIEEIILNSVDNRLIHVPCGYGTAFQAIEEGSEILVFADHYLDHAQYDDYTYELDYFVKYKQS